MRRAGLAVALVCACACLTACASTRHDRSVSPPPSSRPTSTAPYGAATTTTTTTTARTTTAEATSTTRAARPSTSAAARPAGDPYAGLGAWVDVYDSVPAFGGPTVRPADVAAMARAGVRTLYLQVAKDDPRSPGALADPAVIDAFVRAAHAHHMYVVGWYLPTFDRPDVDAARVRAMAARRVDGRPLDSIALDIEDVGHVTDANLRNARLVALARVAMQALGQRIGAIVLPPVATELVNPTVWPGFPWHALAPWVRAWLPMAYSSFRSVASGWHDPDRYTAANVARLRADVGDPRAEVHVIGGLAATFDAATTRRFVGAARAAGARGWSVYDWATTSSAVAAVLRAE